MNRASDRARPGWVTNAPTRATPPGTRRAFTGGRPGFGIVLAGLVATGGACGGSQKPPPPKHPVAVVAPVRPLCAVETSFDTTRPVRERIFPAQNWFVLLLHAYRSTGELARPLSDCTGAPVAMDTDGCGGESMPGWTPTALTEDDLIVTSLGDARRLVWVMTERLSDGQAQGPVAIATIESKGIAVRALGILRAYADNVTLRLERVGDATVLVADGQHCPERQPAGVCERAIRIVPLVGDRFVSKGLIDSQGVCMGSTLFPVRTTGRRGKANRSTYALEASIAFNPNAIAIREHLELSRASTPRSAKDQAGTSFVTNLQLERQLTVRNGRLVTDGKSLLTRWLNQGGGPDAPPSNDE